MLLYPAMKDLLKHINSRYLLVNVVAHRAREIANEAEATQTPLDDKPVTLCHSRGADGTIRMDTLEG